MLTQEALKEMNVGDSFRHGTLFPGVTDEKLKWELVEKTGTECVFIITYLGSIFHTKTLKIEDLKKEGK